MSRKLTTPTGEQWRVRRAWIPRLGHHSILGRFGGRMRKIRSRVKDSNVDPGCLDGCSAVDGLDVLAIAFVVIVVVLLAVFFVVPFVVAIVDVLILLLLAIAAFVFRVVFRRPWLVEAYRSDFEDDSVELHRWPVVGWRASGERIDQIAEILEAGLPVPPSDGP